MRRLVFVAMLLFIASPLFGQTTPDTVITHLQSLATFRDARALATDGKGILYVTDAGKNTLYKLASDGRIIGQVGGTGSGNQQFDEPTDVEATNGLDLYVADFGNKRVQHFSGELRFLESIPLVFETHTARQIAGYFSPNADYDNKLILSEGDPIAVAVNIAQELFVADQGHAFIAKWDRGRRIQRFFGRYDAGDAAVLDPVSMVATANGLVFVADRGRDEVMVFDAFGTFLRRFGDEKLKDLHGIALFGDRLIVSGAHHIWVYEADGTQLFTYALNLKEPVVDVVYAQHHLYVLTPTSLGRFKP